MIKNLLRLSGTLYLLFVWQAIAAADDSEAALSWTQVSNNKLFTLTLYPRHGEIPLSTFHHWIVNVRDRHNKVIEQAQIEITGGMPEHRHGMPSQPLVSRYLGEGNYLIEGMNFTMYGRWLLGVKVQAQGNVDICQFDLSLDY